MHIAADQVHLWCTLSKIWSGLLLCCTMLPPLPQLALPAEDAYAQHMCEAWQRPSANNWQCCAALMPAAAVAKQLRSKRKMPTILLMAATEIRRPLLLPRLLPIRRLCTPLPNLHRVHIAIPHLPPRRSADDVHNTPGRRDPTLQRCDHRLRASLACRHRPARSSTKHAAFHRHRGVHSSGRRLRLGTRRACRHRQSQGRGARRRWLAWGIVRGCLCGASWRRGALLWRWLRRRGAQLGA